MSTLGHRFRRSHFGQSAIRWINNFDGSIFDDGSGLSLVFAPTIRHRNRSDYDMGLRSRTSSRGVTRPSFNTEPFAPDNYYGQSPNLPSRKRLLYPSETDLFLNKARVFVI
jgi:hypothetical protein